MDAQTPLAWKKIQSLPGTKSKAGLRKQVQCPAHDDDKASLSTELVTEPEVKVLVKCHAGCDTEKDVLPAWGMTWSDLFPPQVPVPTLGRVVKEYLYKKADRSVNFKVSRREPKGFFQSRPDGKGGWIANTDGVERTLYRLDEISGKNYVIFVEGEKDVDALWNLGLRATTTVGGAAKSWEPQYTDQLKGAGITRVFVIPDNDGPGHKYMDTVASACHAAGFEVKTVELSDLPDKGDTSDWIAAGGTKGRLEAILKAAPIWEPAAEPVPDEGADVEPGDIPAGLNLLDPNHSDVANARRLVTCYGERIRWVDEFGWLVWDRRRWKGSPARQGNRGPIVQMAIKTVRHWRAQAAEIGDPKESAKEMAKAIQAESRFRLEAMVELAKVHEVVAAGPDQFDRDAYLLNVGNGTLDLNTGTLRAYQREDYLTRVIPTPYVPGSPCPQWLAFLKTIFAGDAEMIGFMQRVLGYTLIGAIRDHILVLMYGIGANGKSTLLGVIQSVLGEYALTLPTDVLLAKKHSGATNDIAPLKGVRMAISIETKRGRQFDEGVVKKLTGGDQITARFLFKENFTFRPTHKTFFAVNHKPAIRDTTDSFWRRVKMVPFEVAIPKADQDTTLDAKLLAESEGILAWAVEGCRQFLAGGLRPPQKVLVATEQYRHEQDQLAPFVADCLEVRRGTWVSVAELYAAYVAWATDGQEGGPLEGVDGDGEDALVSKRDLVGYLVETLGVTRQQKKVEGKDHKGLMGVRLVAGESDTRRPDTEDTGLPVVPYESRNKNTQGTSVSSVSSPPRADTPAPSPKGAKTEWCPTCKRWRCICPSK